MRLASMNIKIFVTVVPATTLSRVGGALTQERKILTEGILLASRSKTVSL